MIFGTFEFFIFLAAVVAAYWFLKPWPIIRKLFLIAASGYYYWLIDSRFAGLIAMAALATFLLARTVRNDNFIGKGAFLLGIFGNLGILLLFKYYDFFRISAQTFLSSIRLTASLPFWEIAFPIGISFYSFRMVSYLIDVRKQKYAAESSVVDFFAYASFFPYMLAGPIVRADEFLPQLKNGGPKQPREINIAATMLFLGLFKKIIVSSWLAQNLTDNNFSVPEQISAATAWLAALGYTFQIYCDFSGYSDIAIAAAMFMGFQLAPNFEYPYRAKSIAEFWRRWHISFYSWMRDYIYIPLGGNRKGTVRSYLNTIFVFALSGLWHGAAGHYLLWGLWHGIGLCAQRLWQQFKLNVIIERYNPKIINNILGWFLTFSFVGLGWILFRAENLERASAFAAALLKFDSPNTTDSAILLPILLIAIFIIYERKLFQNMVKIQKHLPNILWPLIWIILVCAIYYFAPQTIPPFIYFSF
ncbi:MAG: MBOAT family O-acyltransferase [Candidatus Paceibacterota bacterium]